MENYTLGQVVEAEEEILFKGLPENTVHLRVKRGSKIRNLLGYALKSFQVESIRHMVVTGSGQAVNKVITCVEILKRKNKSLHQVTKIMYKKTEDFWEPKKDELDQLKVVHEVPSIQVLLCKDQLDTSQPGYGFVTFETEEEARRIQEEAENIVLKDRKLNIAPAIKKQPFARVYNSAQVVPNGTIMYHNGMPYTYDNGMAYFTPQGNTYQYSPQTQTATSTYPLIYSAPTVFLPPHHYQYHAAGPGVPAHYLYAMPPATSTTTSASSSEMYHYTTAATGSLNTSSMQQIAYVASGSTSDYADGSRAEGSEGMKMSKKAGGNNGSGYGSPRKNYNTLRNGTRGGNNGMAGGDVGASRTVKQIQGQQPHLVAKTVNGVTVMAYPTPIMVTAATPIKDHSSGDHEVVTGEVGIMHQLGAAAHPLTPPHTPVGSDTCEVMRKLQGLAM